MTEVLRLGLVGLGKIARDEHLPAIAATPGLELAAVASRNARADGVRNYATLEEMLAEEPGLDAIVLCQPPQARFEAARAAILAGKHLFLEKPPGATVSEVEALIALSRSSGVTLYASWHSRYGSAVSAARDWLALHEPQRVSIFWKEDVRHWHPGQNWIWEPGGFGVFDPGINALSILTGIVPGGIRLIDAELEVPENRHAPIAARLEMESTRGVPIFAEFDWRQTGPQTWDIVVEVEGHRLCLGHGGNVLSIDGRDVPVRAEGEYPALYRRFRDSVAEGESDVDLSPLQLVADAFLRGRTRRVEAFHG